MSVGAQIEVKILLLFRNVDNKHFLIERGV